MEVGEKRLSGDELASGSDEPAAKRQRSIALDGLASAQKQVDSAQTQVELALKDLVGAHEAGNEQKVKEAEQKVEKAEQKVEKAKAEVEKAEQKVEKAKAEVEKANAEVERYRARVARSVLDRLEGCMVKRAINQYGKYLGHANTTLRDRKEALQVLAEAVVQSVVATADCQRHLVVFAGPAGSGKTRAGYEGSVMWDHAGGQEALKEALKGRPDAVAAALSGLQGPASDDKVLTLYVDLNNGQQYHSEIDKLNADERLGARLAARALGCVLGEMVNVPPEQLLVKNALSAILRGQLGRRQNAGITATLLLVVHVDEWQSYMQVVVDKQKVDIRHAVADVRLMFSALNSFASDPPADLQGKFVLLPILSGTPVLGGVHLEVTARMKRVDGPLPVLSSTSADHLFVEELTKKGSKESEVRNMLKSVTARVALSDTGYFPRLLLRLCDHVVQSVAQNRASGDEQALWHVSWVKGAEKASEDLPRADRVDHRLRLLALTGEAVEIKDPFGDSEEEGLAKVVRDADRRGIVQLRRVRQDVNLYVVEVPFLMLRSWCSGHDFPERLLRSLAVDERWTWEEFEQLYAHFTVARLNALLDIVGDQPAGMALNNVIKGARGPASLLAQRVRLACKRQVYWEGRQFMPRKDMQPEKVHHVLAAPARCPPAAEINLHEGIFLARGGNSLFDMRYTLKSAAADQPALHVFVQYKHTGTDTTTVNVQAISEWYAEAEATTRKWCVGKTDTVALLFFTNRELTDPGALDATFFDCRQRLLVVTKTELSDALTPALAGRGLIPQNARTPEGR